MGNFNHRRFEEALQYRNKTISELSEITSISRQTLTKYKRADNINEVNLRNIAKALDFPVKFFCEKSSEVNGSNVYFRSQLTTKKGYRGVQKIKLKFLASIYNFLKEYLDFPEIDLPDCNGLSPEQAARKVRQAWGLGNGPIDNLINIIESHGIVAVCYDTDTDAIDAFSQRYILDSGKKVFFVAYSANKKSASRIHFDIAHELGHLVMHEWDLTEELDKIEFIEHENEANRFASEFLLPQETFYEDAIKTPLSISAYTKLKMKWKVSIQAMLMRSKNLNVISYDAYRDRIIYMQKRGFRKNEPLDSELKTAEPNLLRTAVMLLINNKVFDADDFMKTLSEEHHFTINSLEAEKLLALPARTLCKTKILQFDKITLKNNYKPII